MIQIEQLDPAEVERIREIDRTETITTGYEMRDGKLTAMEVDWQAPPWPEDGPGDYSIRHILDMLKPIFEEADGVLLGALDGEKLAGLAVLRPVLEEGMAQLAGLWVSAEYRRQGVARRLNAEIARLAREAGAKRLYVSATPSESAVGFYLSEGFEIADEVHEELFALEPEDIHMIKVL